MTYEIYPAAVREANAILRAAEQARLAGEPCDYVVFGIAVAPQVVIPDRPARERR